MSLGTVRSNQGLKTERAKRLLVRYIREQGLERGDCLLPQNELRRQLDVGAVTISRAVQALSEEGILTTKPRVGTYVLDPNADGRCGRVVGLATFSIENGHKSAFFTYLLHCLQARFHELGCQTVIFPMQPKADQIDSVSLDYFPGLERSVYQGELDAVALVASIDEQSWRKLEKAKMCPFFVGSATPAPRGVYVDVLQTARLMVENLIERGCRRPAIAMPSGELHGDFWPMFCELLKDLADADPEALYFTADHIEGGHRIAHALMGRTAEDRPDGIAIVDDYIGMGLTCELARERVEYFPHLTCMVNTEVALDFPFKDIVFFEVNVRELAHTAAGMITEWFKDGKIKKEQTWMTARRVGLPMVGRQTELV